MQVVCHQLCWPSDAGWPCGLQRAAVSPETASSPVSAVPVPPILGTAAELEARGTAHSRGPTHTFDELRLMWPLVLRIVLFKCCSARDVLCCGPCSASLFSLTLAAALHNNHGCPRVENAAREICASKGSHGHNSPPHACGAPRECTRPRACPPLPPFRRRLPRRKDAVTGDAWWPAAAALTVGSMLLLPNIAPLPPPAPDISRLL